MKFPDQFRARFPVHTAASAYNSNRGDPFGAFVVPVTCDQLFCIATDGRDPDAPAGEPRWEHAPKPLTPVEGRRPPKSSTFPSLSKSELFPERRAPRPLKQ